MTTMHGSLECEDALIKRAGFLLDIRGGKPALTIYFQTGDELLDKSRLRTSPFLQHQKGYNPPGVLFFVSISVPLLILDGRRNLQAYT